MFKTIIACLVVVLLGSVVPAFAGGCDCTYSGERPCFVLNNCEGEETPRCNCGTLGCSTSCGPAAPYELGQAFSSFQFSDMLLEGIATHFDDSGWKFVTTSPDGKPLSTERQTMDYSGLTFEDLMRTLAGLYNVCVEIAAEDKVVTFKQCG